MKRNLILLLLFLPVGLYAQNNLFWYPDSCLQADLNAVLHNTTERLPKDSCFLTEVSFAGDSVHFVLQCRTFDREQPRKTEERTMRFAAARSLDTAGNVVLSFKPRAGYKMLWELKENRLNSHNPIVFSMGYVRSVSEYLVIEKRGASNIQSFVPDSVVIRRSYVNMTGPYTLETWKYEPSDSVRYRKKVTEIGGKRAVLENREVVLPPADWEALRKELIRLNVIAWSQTANRFMTDHGFNTRIAIWSEGKEYSLSYSGADSRSLPDLDFLLRTGPG